MSDGADMELAENVIRDLRAEVARLQTLCDGWLRVHKETTAERDLLAAELARVRKEADRDVGDWAAIASRAHGRLAAVLEPTEANIFALVNDILAQMKNPTTEHKARLVVAVEVILRGLWRRAGQP